MGTWALWTLPTPAIVYVLAVDAVAFGVALLPGPIRRADLAVAALLLAVFVLQHEAALTAERSRLRVSSAQAGQNEAAYLVPTTVYTMATAMLLPPLLIGLSAVALYGYRWARITRPRLDLHKGPGYRMTFNCASVVLAGAAVWTVRQVTGLQLADGMTNLQPVLTLAIAIAVYAIVQFGLVAAAVSAAAGSLTPARTMARALCHHGMEISQLSIGALAAFLLASPSPWLAVLLAPMLWLFTQAILVSRLQAEAAADSATGLLNAAAWHRRAGTELQRARRRGAGLGVLVIDIDAFRQINNAFGTRAGDRALAHIAHGLSAAVREDDAIGRMHGEEFVVVAPCVDATDLAELSSRITGAVRQLDFAAVLGAEAGTAPTLTASVGTSIWPADADSVDELLAHADAALRVAKISADDRTDHHASAPHQRDTSPSGDLSPTP
ncbi:GGDEF domain-containing protein [Pseudonocardia sediminis]|nr:GGDEF domain-containing protein [Pseudonocardia sediminis]